jgi:hypothetical protein
MIAFSLHRNLRSLSVTISLAERPCPFISFLKSALQPFYPYAFSPGYRERRRAQSTRFSQSILFACMGWAPLMGQAFLINSAPQISPFTSNGHGVNLIQIPGVSRWDSTFFDRSSIHWTKFVTPTADSFVGNNNSTFSQKIFYEWSDTSAKAEAESMIQPGCMAYDFGRKTVSSIKLV